MKIKEYFNTNQNKILVILILGLLLLIIRDIPFLNIVFPENSTSFLLIVITSVLFRWHRSFIFYVILIIPIIVLYITGSVSQAEQVAILIFVILSTYIVEQALALFKE